MFNSTVDIVIPLGNGSLYDNFELRMALRSIAEYARNCGKVWVVTDAAPDWLCNVRVINHPDRHRHNKDANIIEKLLAATQLDELSERFIFWSDDKLALKSFNCADLLPIFNRRQRSDFTTDRIWHRRVRNTFDYLQARGHKLQWNWESHTPQIMNKKLYRELMSTANYTQAPGLTVCTLYFGLNDTPPLLEQRHYKITVESSVNLTCLDDCKLFLGYNDAALRGNLPQLLLERFPQKCNFEKRDGNYQKILKKNIPDACKNCF